MQQNNAIITNITIEGNKSEYPHYLQSLQQKEHALLPELAWK